MPTVTSVPGVYIEEDASPAISVNQGATSVPLFIARFTPKNDAQKGVITRISSWLEYTTLFEAIHNVSASVQIISTESAPDSSAKESSDLETKKVRKSVIKSKTLLDANSDDYTYSIGKLDLVLPTTAELKLYFQNGGSVCYLYPLENKDDPKLNELVSLIDEIPDITLISCPEIDTNYRSAVYSVVAPLLDQNKNYFLLADSNDGRSFSDLGDSPHAAVYYPSLITPKLPIIDNTNVTIQGYVDKAGSKVTTLVDLIKINSSLASDVSNKVNTSIASQWLIPPSLLMAGVYCKTDNERGVWKAPANIVLNGVDDISVRVTDENQGNLNNAGINVIRYFSGKGLVVWGARTLRNDDDWRYIPVRRLFDTAERDIKKAMRSMIFEPNNQPTWKRVQTAIEQYLYNLWKRGGLTGNKPEEAYFVLVGKGSTMTNEDINQGKMIVQIGMAAVRPAEFIILQITQDVSQ